MSPVPAPGSKLAQMQAAAAAQTRVGTLEEILAPYRDREQGGAAAEPPTVPCPACGAPLQRLWKTPGGVYSTTRPAGAAYEATPDCVRCRPPSRRWHELVIAPSHLPDVAARKRTELLAALDEPPADLASRRGARDMLLAWIRGELDVCVLWGPSRTGKTYMALYALGQVYGSSPKRDAVRFIDEPTLVAAYRGQYADGREDRAEREWAQEVRRQWRRAEVLVFDDFGSLQSSAEGVSEAVQEFSSDGRYTKRLIVTSNASPYPGADRKAEPGWSGLRGPRSALWILDRARTNVVQLTERVAS